MKSYKYIGKWNNFTYICLSFFRVNKIRLCVLGFVLLVGFLTGIFTAIKYAGGCEILNFNDYGLTQFANGNIASSKLFFERLLSYTCFCAILLVCSLAPFLFPIGLFVIAFRSYLLGLNACLLIIMYGLGGIRTAIIIIIPAQIIMLALGCLFFCIVRNRAICKKKYGKIYGLNSFLLFGVFILLLTIVNLLETILLLLFSAQVILVI